MKIRINNIECREYCYTTDTPFYEIVKWQPNDRFGKREEYLEKGWEIEGEMVRKDNISFSESFFDTKEHCFTIAVLRLNKREPDVYLESVGSRLVELNKQERNDFFKVYKQANKLIYKKHFK